LSQFEHELRDQPSKIAGLVARAEPIVDALASLLHRANFSHLVLSARGSSDNAARYGQYLFGLRNELVVALAAPSLTSIYGRPPRFDGALLVGVSQSGQSPDVVSVLQAGRQQGRPTVAVTNDIASPLATSADEVIDLGFETERAIAATGTYTGSLTALAILSAAMLEDSGVELEALRALPEQMAHTIEVVFAQLDGRELVGGPITVLGRGLNYATAFETALKLRELTGVPAEAFSPPDLTHGPIASLAPDSPVVIIAPDEPSSASLVEFVPRLRAQGVRLTVVSGDPSLLEAADAAIELPIQPIAHLTPVTAVVAGQALALQAAQRLGRDVDRPPGLEKVTTTR
jgi:glutamine---fructose-6-phosphate transaminase (isomerizing)